jgi:PhoPQ-activated pathogenicity-related protein
MKRLTYILFVLVQVLAVTGAAEETALDRYVAKPDANYSFFQYDTDDDFLYKTYFLNMTSQQWRIPAEVDRVLWQHDVLITVPAALFSDSPKTAILLIDGGQNGDDPPDQTNEVLAAIAVTLGSVVAVVKQIPNQPLFFTDEDNRKRTEDEILAYSFDKYLDTNDEEWPVHLAMTKAVVRAMDTIQSFLATKSVDIDDFIVFGGSKRGWTTWLTAAVDNRVKAIAPASIDMLNLGQQFVHQWGAYGFYAPALKDYVEFDLPCRMQSPAGQQLLKIVDPYAYRERYIMPKFVANSAGDQFFLPDSSQFYYPDLPTPKLLRYSPNTDHAQNIDVILSATAWLDDILDGKSSPQYSWTFEPDGSIQVQVVTQPDTVRLWQATNPNGRDFRLEVIGPAWTSSELQDIGSGVYVGFVPPPAQGWTAFMVELTYDSPGELEADQVYTTDIRVTPDTLPFAGTQCSPTVPGKVGVFRNGQWFLDRNGDGQWNGCGVDGCAQFGVAGDKPVSGDWNHDGFSEIGVYRNGNWFLDLNGNRQWDGCGMDGCTQFGAAGDKPVSGDWNHDGFSEIGVYRNGTWLLDLNGNDQWDGCGMGEMDGCIRFGAPNDYPVAGDWNRDGFADLGVYRSSAWLLDLNGNRQWDDCGVDGCFPFGAPSDYPVVSDWNNAGFSQGIGVKRGGSWFLDRNGNSVWEDCLTDVCITGFGAPGDVPVAGRWTP